MRRLFRPPETRLRRRVPPGASGAAARGRLDAAGTARDERASPGTRDRAPNSPSSGARRAGTETWKAVSEGSGTGARYRRAAAKAAGSRGRRGSAQPGVEGCTLCGHRSSSSRACSPKSSKNTWDFKKRKKKRAAGAAGSGGRRPVRLRGRGAEPLLLAGAAQGALLLATGGGAAGRGRATSGLQGDQGTWRPLSGTSWKGSFPVVCLGWEVSDGSSHAQP